MSDRPSLSRIAPGTRLNEIYEIDRLVASGGMGEVYRGHTIHTGDPVAIKLLRPEFGENDAALALFRKEASALHNLQHDAIVRYYVCSVDPLLQRPYLAMEFVEGQSLSQLLREGPLTFEAVRTLAQRMAAGLQAAHQRGIIHRDVAPDNIIIPSGDVGRAKIIDFGIARSTTLGDGTIIGDGFAGKYNYVSPEQLGLFGGDVTAKSDIYSLGLVLAEAINGRPIDMGGSQVQVVEKRRKVPELGGIDLRLRPLLEKMLQPEPAKRLESMVAVANWPFGTTPSPGRRGQRAETIGRDGRSMTAVPSARRGWSRLALAAGVAAIVLIGGGGAAYYFLLQPESPKPEPVTPILHPDIPPKPDVVTPVLSPPGPAVTPQRPPVTPVTPPGPSVSPPGPKVTPPAPPNKSVSAPPLTGPEPLHLGPGRPRQTPTLTPTLTPTPTPAPPKTALLTPAPPPAPSNAGRIDQITHFIDNYDGGDCFFVTPIAVGERAAKIEGFGSSLGPFQAFDSAFKQSAGFDADIGLLQVTPPQCPAIGFLNQFRAQRGTAPRLEISETKLNSGQTLAGTVDGYRGRHLELLLVSDDGSVLNITKLAKPRDSGVAFNLRLQLQNTTGAQPQMLIAVASAQPLAALQVTEPANASQLFAAAASEAGRSGQALAVAAKYFKLQ